MEAVIERTKKKKKKVSKATEEYTSESHVPEASNVSKIKDCLEVTEESFKSQEPVNHTNEKQESSNNDTTEKLAENSSHVAEDTKLAANNSTMETLKPIVESQSFEVENVIPTVSSIENEPPFLITKSKESHRVADELSSLDKYLDMNKQILQTLENIDSIPAQISSLHKQKTIPEMSQEREEFDIKPYSEQQLSALYYNNELDMLEEFTNSYVEAELRCLPVKQHNLYDLLVNYLKVREKITGNNLEIEQLRREYRELQNALWTMETATVTGRAECQDGQIVSASHSYSRSIFHRSVFQNIVRLLGNIQKLLYENHVLYSYSAEDLRLQIELYLHSVVLTAVTVMQVNRNTAVSLSMQAESAHLKPYLSEIRLSISVLFAFQRKLIRDAQFLKETREWLTQLVAILLRVANYQDHLFVINHILRCPAGVGTWASSFLQAPLSLQSSEEVFANYQINHLLSILSVILSPVKEREKFLKDVFFAAFLAIAFAAPEPEADPKPAAKPGIVAPLAYSAPLVAAPAVSYAYSAPLAYSSYIAAPSVYAAGYTAGYSAYPYSALVI